MWLTNLHLKIRKQVASRRLFSTSIPQQLTFTTMVWFKPLLSCRTISLTLNLFNGTKTNSSHYFWFIVTTGWNCWKFLPKVIKVDEWTVKWWCLLKRLLSIFLLNTIRATNSQTSDHFLFSTIDCNLLRFRYINEWLTVVIIIIKLNAKRYVTQQWKLGSRCLIYAARSLI